MKIRWYGQSTFALTGASRVAIDPFGDMSAAAAHGIHFDYPAIEGLEADLLLITHEHGDHNGVEAVGGDPVTIRSTAGTFDSPAGEVVGVASEHDAVAGTQRGPNTIFRFTLDGLRVCHLGDFGQPALRPEQQAAIGEVDVLFLPAGAGPTVGGEAAAAGRPRPPAAPRRADALPDAGDRLPRPAGRLPRRARRPGRARRRERDRGRATPRRAWAAERRPARPAASPLTRPSPEGRDLRPSRSASRGGTSIRGRPERLGQDRPSRCSLSACIAAWSCSSESGPSDCGVAAVGPQAVEQPVEMAAPGVRGDLGGGVDQRPERPESQSEVRQDEVDPKRPLLPGALERPLEDRPELLACAREPALAWRVAHQHVLQHAIACLELERPFEHEDDRLPRVRLGLRCLAECDELADPALEDRLDERLPTREVAIEGPDPEPGPPGDLFERGVHAPFGEHLTRCGDEELVVSPRVAPMSRVLPGDFCHSANGTTENGGMPPLSATVKSMAALARFCIAHRRLVVVAWIVLLVGIVAGWQIAGSHYSTNFTLGHTDAQRAADLLQSHFPAQSGDTDQIVFHAKNGKLTDPAVQSAIEPMLAAVEKMPHVTSVTSPFDPNAGTRISKDGTIGFATVTFDEKPNALPVSAIKDVISRAQTIESDALQVELGGQAIEQTEFAPPSATTGIGVLAAVIVLLISFGSFLAMGLPIVTALFGLGTGIGLIGLSRACRRDAELLDPSSRR